MEERSALNVAEYLLCLNDPELGESITNLKLQKLLYYCQGTSLALYDRPLFSEPIVAWEHGPVVPEVYRTYKDHGSGMLPLPKELHIDGYTPQEIEMIEEVHQVFGQFSGWKLREMTHNENPWKDTPRNEVIPHEAIKAYFKQHVVN